MRWSYPVHATSGSAPAFSVRRCCNNNRGVSGGKRRSDKPAQTFNQKTHRQHKIARRDRADRDRPSLQAAPAMSTRGSRNFIVAHSLCRRENSSYGHPVCPATRPDDNTGKSVLLVFCTAWCATHQLLVRLRQSHFRTTQTSSVGLPPQTSSRS